MAIGPMRSPLYVVDFARREAEALRPRPSSSRAARRRPPVRRWRRQPGAAATPASAMSSLGWTGPWRRQERILSEKADSGEKGPEPEQQHQHEAGGLHWHQLLKTLQEHEIHRDNDRRPVRDLGPDEPDPGLAVGCIRPAPRKMHKSPMAIARNSAIAVDRAAREIAIGHPEYRQRQHHEIGQVPQQ